MSAEDMIIEFTEAAGNATDVSEVQKALEELTQARIGVKLFTLMTFDRESRLARRSYTNMPDAYPSSGTKPVGSDHWTSHVLDGRNSFVANDIESIAAVFDDHELIQSLGCESVLNVPIVVGGEVLGTINCLHEAGFYTPDKVAAAEILKLPGSVCFLMEKLSKGGQ
ncbi:GAF domain-containing protein [Hoeflea prorocentri]|uniref:GAF domain-containing protein n=1 Tax=Hoeflea prorocentri TaxID=1922333 RepID=A0A9X3UG13_9HYPH|nr:GAF domain-containing protein [Hoeflea prorocentri]MCY6379865.1 GAF domain-containing protein [Hoeflea prorocentri]MDA5397665.1 GAF domain-containing protein [Hoeflea prorocentri]